MFVPKPYVPTVLHLAHSYVLWAHLVVEKTRQQIASRFHWPVRAEEDYCCTCVEKMRPKPHFKSPLIHFSIIYVLFSYIAMNLVGPLAKSARGYQYILVILDYATRYPQAIPYDHRNDCSGANPLGQQELGSPRKC